MKKFLILFSIIIIIFLGGGCNEEYKQVPLDTLMNYPGYKIIDRKSFLFRNDKIVRLRSTKGDTYNIKEIRIVLSEFILFNVGDTIDISLLK